MKDDAAFPHMAAVGHRDYAGGMSKREYFAAQALAGLCANPGGPFQADKLSGWTIVNCDQAHIARECLQLADALVEALSVTSTNHQDAAK